MRLLLILCVIILASCTSTKSVMDSWIGKPKQHLIMSWGPPVNTTSDGGDGEVLVYARNVYNPMNNTTMYDCKMFYIDKDGSIYHWLTRRSLVPPTQISVDVYPHRATSIRF